MMRLQHLPISEIHMYSARQAWIETSNCPHNIDSLEVLRAVLFEDRRILHRIFIWARRAEAVPRIRIPRRWRIRMIIRDLVIANHDVVRQHATHSLVEAASYPFFGNLEVIPCPRPAG